jgi:hypothetical protein
MMEEEPPKIIEWYGPPPTCPYCGHDEFVNDSCLKCGAIIGWVWQKREETD